MGMRSVSEVEVSFVRLGRSFFYERLAVLARVLSACWCTEGIVFCVNENSRPEEGCSVPPEFCGKGTLLYYSFKYTNTQNHIGHLSWDVRDPLHVEMRRKLLCDHDGPINWLQASMCMYEYSDPSHSPFT